jgi:hypothetical protein
MLLCRQVCSPSISLEFNLSWTAMVRTAKIMRVYLEVRAVWISSSPATRKLHFIHHSFLLTDSSIDLLVDFLRVHFQSTAKMFEMMDHTCVFQFPSNPLTLLSYLDLLNRCLASYFVGLTPGNLGSFRLSNRFYHCNDLTFYLLRYCLCVFTLQFLNAETMTLWTGTFPIQYPTSCSHLLTSLVWTVQIRYTSLHCPCLLSIGLT